MMRFLVVFSLLVTCALSKYLSDPDSNRIKQMIESNGYSAQIITVTTEDGYILDLVRIPNGRNVKSQQNSDRDSSYRSSGSSGLSKPVVLLMHGLMGSAEDFVYGGATQGLAFVLADQGYDVFLGNSRGSFYGQRHTKLNPNKDEAFWKFCWDQVGTKDLPAIIDQILTLRPQTKIKVVGWMEGSSDLLVLGAVKSGYNDKIESMVALGPVAFMKKSTNPIVKVVEQNMKSRSWVLKNLGNTLFRPSNELIAEVQNQCIQEQQIQSICNNIYYLFNGFNSNQLNQTIVEESLKYVPTGGTVTQVMHYAQLMMSGGFGKYSLNGETIPDYDLSKVTIPVTIIYTPNDSLSQTSDVDLLIAKLPNVVGQKCIDTLTNNLDLVYGNNVELVNQQVIQALSGQKL